MKVGRKPAGRRDSGGTNAGAVKGKPSPPRRRGSEGGARNRRTADAPPREARARAGARTRPPQEPRAPRQRPQTVPAPRPVDRPARPKTTSQAKARAKARKAKAPKVIRPPLRERLAARLEKLDLRPQVLLARIPFVVLVIGALAVGLAITLWLSTDAAQRSYQLGNARELNEALNQQKEALERDVLEAQSAPALADAARDLGMIPSKDTAHLVQDPAGNWVVVGQPKPAEGAPPPPLNTKLPDELPVTAKPAGPAPKPGAAVEVPVRLPPAVSGAAVPGAVLPGAVLPGAPVPTAPGAALPGAAAPGAPVAAAPGAPVAAVPGAPAVMPGTPGVVAGAAPSLPLSPTEANPHAATGSALPGPAPLPGPAATAQGDTLAVPPAVVPAVPVPTVAYVPPVTDVAAGVAPVGVAH
ncbi:hypothetical protein [Mycolicibacterium sp.]|uniref:hypothetical protein n=1 Tax=Mycolicibacterium sp. TaxID=2320850 RepID=UPI0034530879